MKILATILIWLGCVTVLVASNESATHGSLQIQPPVLIDSKLIVDLPGIPLIYRETWKVWNQPTRKLEYITIVVTRSK